MGPRLGTDTPGPGEAVFAIRFNGKPQFVWKNWISEPAKKLEKIENPNFGILDLPRWLYIQFFHEESESAVRNLRKPQENQHFRDQTVGNHIFQKPKCSKNRKSLTTITFSARAHSQVAIYTVFHAESESAVRNLRKLQENHIVKKTKILKQFSANPLFSLFFLFWAP